MDVRELLDRLQQQLEEGEWILTLGLLPEESQRWKDETIALIAQVPKAEAYLTAIRELPMERGQYLTSLEEGVAIVADLMRTIAAQAGIPLELERDVGPAIGPILPPWSDVRPLVTGASLPEGEKGAAESALQTLWSALEQQGGIAWEVVREGTIAAAKVDRNLFFTVIHFLIERMEDIE
jgi:hypothetical protein